MEDIIDLLEEQGELPDQLREKIMALKDLDTIRKWHKLAAASSNIEEFKEKTGL